MGNNLLEIGKYLTTLYDDVLVHSSKYNFVEKNRGLDTEFQEIGWVKVPTILVDKLGFYRFTNEENVIVTANVDVYADYNGNIAEGNRAGYPIGGVAVKWTLYRIRFDRARQQKFDRVDFATAGGEKLIAKSAEDFYRTAVIPEKDAVYTSIILDCANTSLGNKAIEAVNASNIVGKLIDAESWEFDHGVAEESQVILLSRRAYILLIQSPLWINYRGIGKFAFSNGDKEIELNIETFNGKPIVVLPKDRNFSDVKLTANGYTTSATSRELNFAIVSKEFLYPVDRLENVKMYDDSVVTGFDGFLANYHFWYDLIIPVMKRVGIYVSLNNELLGEDDLEVAVSTIAGESEGTSIVEAVYTQPAGIKWAKLYVKTTAFGDIGTTESEGTLVEVGSPFVPAAANLYVCVTDINGVILAKSTSTVAFEGYSD